MSLLRALGRRLEGLSRSRSQRLVALADAARDARRWAEAAELYQRALSRHAEMPGIWVQLGHALKESGQLDGAIGAYRRALELDASLADTHLQLGHALKLAGSSRAAERAYRAALALDPLDPHAGGELVALGWTRRRLRAALEGALVQGPPPAPARSASVRPLIAFDICDLVEYAQHARRPTGIQRVQMEIVRCLIETPPADADVAILTFSRAANFWIELPVDVVQELIAGLGGGPDQCEARFRALLGRLQAYRNLGEDFAFPAGARLVNLGSSWAFGNYFLAVRRARARCGIVYIPFVHDVIPIRLPDAFVPSLVRDFCAWFRGILLHADGLLVNSRATAADLEALAGDLGHPPPPVHIVTLDALFAPPGGPSEGIKAREVLAARGVRDDPYVLFVSTIEPRKNHALVFEAWRRMIARAGGVPPRLICVGRPGWRFREALAMLEADRALAERVSLLSDLSDVEVAALYRGAILTLYPSRYEGWGLPVTEALSHGRVPLIANASSLPEAGGPFAEYFDLDVPGDFDAKLAQLLDATYRSDREAAIRLGFRPRTWTDVARDVVAATLAVKPSERAAASSLAALVPGRFYALARNREASVSAIVPECELVRAGPGWAEPDARGSALTTEGEAGLVIQLPKPVAGRGEAWRLRLLLLGHGLPADSERGDDGRHHRVEIRDLGARPLASVTVRARESRWVEVRLDTADGGQLSGVSLGVFGPGGEARAGRTVSVVTLHVLDAADPAMRLSFLEGMVLEGWR